MFPREFFIYCIFLVASLFIARLIIKQWKLKELGDKQARFIIILAIVLSGIFYYFTYMALHNNFNAGATDFLTFAQSLWNIIHNNTPYLTFQKIHFLRDHFSPIWYLIAQIFRIWPSVDWLVLLSSFFVAGCAGVIYAFSKEILKSEWLGLALGISYLLNPYYQLGQLAAVHADSFTAIFICLSLFFLQKENQTLFILTMLVALLGKEDVGLYYGGLGFYIWMGKHKREQGIMVSLIGFVYSFTVLIKIMPMLGPDTTKLVEKYYSQFGSNLPEILSNCIQHPWVVLQSVLQRDKIFTLFYIFVQTAFTSLFSGWALVPLAVSALFKSSTNYIAMYNFRDHYSLHMLPFFYFSSAMGLKKITESKSVWITRILNKLVENPDFQKKFAAVMLIIFATLINFEFGNSPLSRKFKFSAYVISEHNKIGSKLLNRIPQTASVMAQENIAPHLAFRKEIYAITSWVYYGKTDEKIAEPEYVVFDLLQAKSQNVEKAVLETAKYFYSNSKYNIWIEEEGWVILKRKK